MSAIIVDVDDALLMEQRPNEPLIAALNASGDDVIVVSARPDSRTDETRKALHDAGLQFAQIHLSDFPQGPNSGVAFKAYKAEKLLADGYPVKKAIDNDVDARAAYTKLGLETFTPASYVAAEGRTTDDAATIQGTASNLAGADKGDKMSIEFRTGVAELRAVGEDGMTFEGIAAVYDSPSAEGTNPEVVKPGAFSRSLAASQRGEWDIKAYADHNPERLLGTTKSGTLELTDTAEGLRARIKLNPDISYHRDLAAIVKTMGKSLGLSFGFFSTAANRVNDQGVRELRDVKLVEVSALTGLAPYYPATIATVAVRSLAETAGIDVAELGQALAALAAGTATPDQARLITTAVASIIAEDGIESAEDQMESEDLAAATAEVIGAIEPQSDAPAMASVPRSIREKEMDLARRAVK